MARGDARPIRSVADVRRFEQEAALEARLPGPGILDVFERHARERPDRVALTMLMTGADDEEPRRVGYGELLGLLRQAANAFHTLAGPRAGVAYLLPNLVQTHVTLWGATASGYAVPINFLLRPEHVAELVRASGARILVALGPHPVLDIWSTALAVRDAVPGLHLVRVGAPSPEDVPGLDDLLAAQPSDRLVFDPPGRGDDLAAYLHTGGTTGNPRLVTLTHRSQLAAALGGMVLADSGPDDVLLANLPLFHAGGTVFCGLSVFLAGGELVVMSPAGLRNPAMVEGFWRIAARHRATLVGAVPTGLAAVVEVPIGDADLSAVRSGFTGASSIPPSVGERFRALTGRKLCEVYGMTEASGVICVDPTAGPGAPGSVGIRLPYTEVTVRKVAAEHDGPGLGEECGTGEIGQVVVRGPTVSPGYRDPGHDAGVFEEGHLLTGDLGYTDEAGNLYIAGRVKDLIIRSGHNIDPLMIENAMTEHPAVALAAAVGMPDDYAGEVPIVYVSLLPGAQATVAELEEHARRTIGERPAWPRQIVVVDSIPLTAVGKIFKPTLRLDGIRRLVERVVHEDLGLPGAQVAVTAGGPRGTRVDVTLPAPLADRRGDVETALAAYLFETVVGP
jgi:fatty-acyl-CoA synthase